VGADSREASEQHLREVVEHIRVRTVHEFDVFLLYII
jgi:uncharacterized protein YgfB (UPF0149 family)